MCLWAILFVHCTQSRLGAQQAAAPSPVAGTVRGRVLNAVGLVPIAHATIELTRPGSALVLSRVSAGEDGSFDFTALTAGQYGVRIRAIGFAQRELPPVPITRTAPDVRLGDVLLSAVAVALQSIVVRERKQDVMLAPDRNTFAVKDMPATSGGNALDVLRNVPAVDVDLDNVVSLRGNAGVIVQINGRRSPLNPSQLGNFLAQLPAAMVEKIEVITNPSAREAPEGVVGIINIVLRRTVDAGTSGGLAVTGASIGRSEVGVRAGTQRGPLSLFGSYNYFRSDRPGTQTLSRDNTIGQSSTFLDQTGTRSQTQQGHTLTGTATYVAGPRDELSLETIVTTRREAQGDVLRSRDFDSSRTLTASTDRVTRERNSRVNLASTLGYKHRFAARLHTFEAELRGFSAKEAGPVSVDSRAFSPAGAAVGAPVSEAQHVLEQPAERWAKADYVRPLSSALRLETGVRSSLERYRVAFDVNVFDAASASSVPDSSRVTDAVFRQRVDAAYGILVAEHGQFSAQAGVRLERASSQLFLNTRGSRFDNRYRSAFPSGLIVYNVDAKHQLKLSYSTRIQRPDDVEDLDPTLHYNDPLNVSRGNPALKPEYIRALELGIQRSTKALAAQLTPFYRHTLDAVRSIRTIDTAGVTTRTFANVATSDAYGADATLSAREGPVTGFAGASAFRQVSNAGNLGPGLSARTFGWTARLNASWRVSAARDIQALAFYQAPMTVEQGRTGRRTRFSIAGRQKFRDDRVTLSVRVIDPFNSSRETSTTIDPRFFQVSDRRRQIRGLSLTVDWMFGKPGEAREPDETENGGGR